MNPTMNLVGTTLKGVIGGAYAGLIFGFFVSALTRDYVIQRGDYKLPLLFEEAQMRFTQVVILSCIVILSLIGPFIAAASFGPWIRHALYGLLGCVALVVGVALFGALVQGEQPLVNLKGAERTWIDRARFYGIPAAFVVGPIVGIVIGRLWLRQPKFKDSE